MGLRSHSYIIDLEPIPWKRAGKCRDRFYDQQAPEKFTVGLHFRKQHGDNPPFNKPIKVEICFCMPTSRQVAKKGYFFHSFTPDIDNLQKFILDAMVDAAIITDDRLVSILNTCKVYDQHPRTEVTISEIEDRSQGFGLLYMKGQVGHGKSQK
jgi:Holliday junction resolvase RusA-like endonuclease